MSTEARLAVIEQKLTDGDKRMVDIEGKLDELVESAHKQKGFVAGFAAAFSLLFTTVIGLGIYIWQRHFGG